VSGLPEDGARLPAAILAVGDELLDGGQLDTNSTWLGARLAERGWRVRSVTLLGDDEEAIAARLGELARGARLVILTGGLGPTLDDVTRQAVARATGRELRLDAGVVEEIRARFHSVGREMAPSNERQALVPEGAAILPNAVGTAPGFRLEHEGCWIVSLPGPPRELSHMVEEELLPWMAAAYPEAPPPRAARFHLFGLPESDFATRAGDWMARDAWPLMGVCASGRVLTVRIDGTGPKGSEADETFARRVADFRERFAETIFSEEEPSTAVVLGRLLLAEGVSFACAESCTGGEIASRLVAVPGISAVLREGFVAYSNEAKVARLGVDPALLEAHGAVSAEVAAAMARGAAEVSGARLALSTTGVAGPGGGSEEKPVGLVHVGVALDGEVATHELRLPPRGREIIRDWAATSACELARRALVRVLPGGPASGTR